MGVLWDITRKPAEDALWRYRCDGLEDWQIARELAKGLPPEELWTESAYWWENGEEGVADELADLAEAAEGAGYMYLAYQGDGA